MTTRTRIGQTDVSEQDLQLYFDGELTGAEAHELAAQIEAEPDLKRELEQLGVLRDIASAGLMRKAEEVPAARFEQIWDEIDRAIERDARAARAATETPGSFWARLRSVVRPLRVPAIAAVAAAAAVVVALRVGAPGPNKDEEVASVEDAAPAPSESADATPTTEPAMSPVTPPDADSLAPEGSLAFDAPKPAQANIERVEFGGKNGRISQNGTVTVLYVEEDVKPEDSERSL